MKPVKQSSKKNKSEKSKLTETVCWHENKVWESEGKKTLNYYDYTLFNESIEENSGFLVAPRRLYCCKGKKEKERKANS